MIKRNDFEKRHLEKVSRQRTRKPYKKPKLVEYGHIEKLTRGASGTGSDAGPHARKIRG
ncbi:MAG: lasso RiPP family leader peptide-containing protein [Nitrospirota bacterium]|nr:lasso RiPP family leader peptide-containing protein [Nitrospirota bacterium]MDH5768402.1 lasso RiPP family leader peptide-containing protein [Nitrospirota bacterium]